MDATPLFLTIKVASLATMAAFLAGTATALVFSRFRFTGRELLDAVFTLPMVLPPTVLGYYLIVLFGKEGWIGHFLYRYFGVTLMFTWQGAVIAAAVVAFPLVFKSARAAIEGVDKDLENTARVLGKGEAEVFIRVTLPLAARGIVAGVMLAFARAMGEFGATLMIAGNIPGKTQTISMAVYNAVQTGNDNLANMLVIIMSIVCITVLLAAGRLCRTTE
ncbi:MAG: molybdate ABC transporter permease subunit [Dissulfuribacterales bacterium]